MAELVHFAHGIVEDGGDDAAVTVAGRSGVPLAETKAAHECLALFVEREFQVHTVGIVRSAGGAVVFRQLEVAGFVAMELVGHGDSIAGIGVQHMGHRGTESSVLIYSTEILYI